MVRSARMCHSSRHILSQCRAETIHSTDCSNDMSEEQKLRRKLVRHRAVLRLVSDRRAAAALRELIERTRDRLKQIKLRTNSQTGKLGEEFADRRSARGLS